MFDETPVPLKDPPVGLPYGESPSVSSASHKSGSVAMDGEGTGSTVIVEVSDAVQPLEVTV